MKERERLKTDKLDLNNIIEKMQLENSEKKNDLSFTSD